MNRAAKAYFQTRVTTTSPGDIVVMLYESAINNLSRAKIKILEKDYAQKGILISKALDIISELDSSLNMQQGGELSENLHKMYFFCNTRLLVANAQMDINSIDQVIKILSSLMGAFKEIMASNPGLETARRKAG